MITKIEKDTLDFLVKKKLTFNQFCICLMLYHKDYAGMMRYTDQIGYLTGGTVIKPDKKAVKEMDDLLERGFLVHENRDKNNYWDLDNFLLTEKFTKGFLDNLEEKAKEFFKAYPSNLLIQNNEVPAKVVAVEEFLLDYIKLLKTDITLHEKIMLDIKGLRYAKMKISNYISSRQWENNAGQRTTQPKFL